MVKLSDVEPGNELQCWMRLGLALVPEVKGDGTPYYIVPKKPGRARNSTLSRFLGWVVINNPEAKVITLQVSAYNSWRQATSNLPRQADISYTAFARVRRFSEFAIQPPALVPGTKGGRGYARPGSIHPNTAPKPYRTVEDVKLV